MRDGFVVQGLFQVLVVPFPTLLWRPVLHVLRDAYPIVRALLLDQIEEILILVCVPWSTMSGRPSHCHLRQVQGLGPRSTGDSNKPPRTTRRRVMIGLSSIRWRYLEFLSGEVAGVMETKQCSTDLSMTTVLGLYQ